MRRIRYKTTVGSDAKNVFPIFNRTMGRYSLGTNCARILFIFLNIFFLFLGSAIAGLAGWMIYLGEDNDYSVITGNTLVSGAALLLAAGIVTVAISGVGIVGACGMWRPLLFLYILLVIFVALIDIVAGITGMVLRDEVASQVKDRMVTAVQDYRPSSSSPDYRRDVNNVVGYVQRKFECCGVNSSIDWFVLNTNATVQMSNRPPSSCRCTVGSRGHCAQYNFTYVSPDTQEEVDAVYQAWNRGCLSFVRGNLKTVAVTMGVLGFSVAAVELLGVVLAIGLFVCIAKRSNYTYV